MCTWLIPAAILTTGGILPLSLYSNNYTTTKGRKRLSLFWTLVTAVIWTVSFLQEVYRLFKETSKVHWCQSRVESPPLFGKRWGYLGYLHSWVISTAAVVDLCSRFRILNHLKLKWIEKGSQISRGSCLFTRYFYPFFPLIQRPFILMVVVFQVKKGKEK